MIAAHVDSRAFGEAVAHRVDWVTAQTGSDPWYVKVADQRGQTVTGFAVACGVSRTIPGHSILRAEQIGAIGEVRATKVGLTALTEAVRRRRVLRLEVGLFNRDPATLSTLSAHLRELGYSVQAPPRSYVHTLMIELEHGPDAVFASLHTTARRHIRAVDKRPVVIQRISDPELVPRLDHLMRETMARTGGQVQHHPWDWIMRFGDLHPTLARLVGLFDTRQEGADALVAYAIGLRQGDHVQYSEAASTRQTDLKMPLGYGLMWDLIEWASETGATWFDLGGISEGSHGSGDPTGGVSDFKRYFAQEPMHVATELVFEPWPVRASAARAISRLVAFLRSD